MQRQAFAVITSNLVFSQWECIFKDPLTTAAAIDRIVHHSRIVEFGSDITSIRAQTAAQRRQEELLIDSPTQDYLDTLPSTIQQAP